MTGNAIDTTSSPRSYGIAPPGYRLPDATHVGRVRLQVSNLERSLAYYRDVLGFHAVERSSDRAVLGAHGDERPLVELVERPGVTPVPRRGRLGLYHFAILLPDRAALGRFLGHLAQIGARAGMSDHFVSEALYLQDPDNLGIEVYADRPRSAWRHEGRQLAMATEPLDAQSVVQAGQGAPWTGMPPGTTIGHVHLHVGDIDEAAAFYHNALGLDKVVWSYPGALFFRRAAITITLARTRGRSARRRLVRTMPDCSTGRSSCRAARMPMRRRAVSRRPVTVSCGSVQSG